MNHPSMAGQRLNVPSHVKHARLIAWVAEIAALTEAADVYWGDGTEQEYDRLCSHLVSAGTMRRLNPAKRPNSYLALSDPSDVARVELGAQRVALSFGILRARPLVAVQLFEREQGSSSPFASLHEIARLIEQPVFGVAAEHFLEGVALVAE